MQEEILKELREIKKVLQTIVSSKERIIQVNSVEYQDLIKLRNSDHVRCIQCEKAIYRDDKYCGYCGAINPK